MACSIRGCTLRLCAKLGDEKGVDVFMDLEGKSSSGLNDEEDALMNEDMQRLASDRQAASSQAAEEPRQSLQEAASSFGDSVQDFVDKVCTPSYHKRNESRPVISVAIALFVNIA